MNKKFITKTELMKKLNRISSKLSDIKRFINSENIVLCFKTEKDDYLSCDYTNNTGYYENLKFTIDTNKLAGYNLRPINKNVTKLIYIDQILKEVSNIEKDLLYLNKKIRG